MCGRIDTYLKRKLRKLRKSGAICSLVVTFLGVWAAFWLTGLGEQSALDGMTRQWLHLAVLESEYARQYALELVDKYGQDKPISIGVQLLDSSAAQQVLRDANVLLLLPLHKASMLQLYVDMVRLLNRSLTVHVGVLESTGYKRTGAEETVRRLVHENAACVAAMAVVVHEELGDFFDERLYDKDAMVELEERAEELKDSALEGRLKESDTEE